MRFEATSIRVLKRALLLAFLLGALGVIAFNVMHPGRAQRLTRLAASTARLDALMMRTERDNAALTDELQRLERGPEGWQALARKEYDMLLEGEYVFRFPGAAAQPD
jgi:cell division protein FtsB